MKDFKRNNKFSGKRKPGGFGGSPERFQTTCTQCGKACDVPFKPNGRKPVLCRDCFRTNGPSQSLPHNRQRGSDLDQINRKLDQILKALGQDEN